MKNTVKNRKDQNVVVLVELKENSKGLVFVIHGLSGNKEQQHIRAISESFLEENYSVVSFDTTNTFGESDGNLEDATITNY